MTSNEYERIQKIIDRKLDDFKKRSTCHNHNDAVETFAMKEDPDCDILKGD